MAARQSEATRRMEITPAVSRSKTPSESLQVMLTDSVLREMKNLFLYTKEATPEMAHDMEMLTYAAYI